MQEAKPYSISKKAVIAAYQRVKANKGTYGVDEQSIEDLRGNSITTSTKYGTGCHPALIFPNL